MMSARVFALLLALEAFLIVYGMWAIWKHTLDALTKALLP